MINRNDKRKKQREPHQKKKTQPRKSMREQLETKYGEVKKNGEHPTFAKILNARQDRGVRLGTPSHDSQRD